MVFLDYELVILVRKPYMSDFKIVMTAIFLFFAGGSAKGRETVVKRDAITFRSIHLKVALPKRQIGFKIQYSCSNFFRANVYTI